MARAFAHAAGVGPHPGKFRGVVTPPADWQTPDDKQNAREMQRQSAISNISEGASPIIPAPSSRTIPKNPPVMKDAMVPPTGQGSSLTDQR
jgi:hypothetical protein